MDFWNKKQGHIKKGKFFAEEDEEEEEEEEEEERKIRKE